MATWNEMAMMNIAAAKLLHDSGSHRPSVTRSYYAAYCALTDALRLAFADEFKYGRNNPAHDQLLALVKNNLRLGAVKDAAREAISRRKIGRNLNHLLTLRISAEYVPGHTIGERESNNALLLAKGILGDLEVAR